MFYFLRKPSAHAVVEQIRSVVPRVLGEKMVSLVLYGPLAASSLTVDEKVDSVNVLIVLRSVDLETLSALSKALDNVRGKSQLSPMVMSVDEMQASTDVFPVTFMEMRRRYQLLAGEDVLAELPISHAHLRLRCEQELKNLLLRMQSVYLLESRRPRDLLASLRRCYAAYLRAARASLVLVDQQPPDTDAELIALVGSHFRVDGGVLEQVAKATGAKTTLGADAMVNLFASFLVVVHHTAEAIDKLPDEVAVLDVTDE